MSWPKKSEQLLTTHARVEIEVDRYDYIWIWITPWGGTFLHTGKLRLIGPFHMDDQTMLDEHIRRLLKRFERPIPELWRLFNAAED